MYSNIVHEEEYKNLKIKIFPDNDPEDPREAWDNFGHMICFHSRYSLGDKHNLSIEELKSLIEEDDIISLPLYLYDHSGITMNTTGFSCPWDSGQVGYIYVSKDEIKREYNVKKITKKLLDRIYKYLEGEVETYDTYLRGDVYGYVIEDKEENHIESCWGFYGYSPEEEKWYVLTEARGMAKYLWEVIEENRKKMEYDQERMKEI